MAYTVHHWGDLISATALSQWLQNHLWVIPTSQSIHIVMISVVFACGAMISMRLLGLGVGGRSISTLVVTLVPWMYIALAGALVTGIVQTLAEPVREFITPAFWWKMLMIAAVAVLTQWFAKSVRRNPDKWDTAATRPAAGRAFALISLALWIAVVYCGRFIAYTWGFHM
ncbi:MAG: DUF6644 family protein [Steroidobacteraceae bacterium]